MTRGTNTYTCWWCGLEKDIEDRNYEIGPQQVCTKCAKEIIADEEK